MIGQKIKAGPFEGTVTREIDKEPYEKIVISTSKNNYAGKIIGYLLSVKIENCPTFYYIKIDPLYNLSRYVSDATIFPSRNEAWLWLMKLRLNVGKEMAKLIDSSEITRLEEKWK